MFQAARPNARGGIPPPFHSPQYYDCYKLPVMQTETNLVEGSNGDEAVNWLWKQWANVLRVRNNGVPIVGFTWYSLTDQIDLGHSAPGREQRRSEGGSLQPGLPDPARRAVI